MARPKWLYGVIPVVIARNPWVSSPKLRAIAQELGLKPKKPFIIFRNPPPWSVVWPNRKPSEKQLAVWTALAKLSKETAGQDLKTRLKTMKERLSSEIAAMKAKKYEELLSEFEKYRRGKKVEVEKTAPVKHI